MPSAFFSPNTYLRKKNDCFMEWKFSMRLFNYSITQSTCAHSFRCTETHLIYTAQCHSVALTSMVSDIVNVIQAIVWSWGNLVCSSWYNESHFQPPFIVDDHDQYTFLRVGLPYTTTILPQGYQYSRNTSSTQKWWYGNIPLSEGATDFYSIDDIVLGPNMGTIKQRLDASQTHI